MNNTIDKQVVKTGVPLDRPRLQYLYCIYDKQAEEAGPVFTAVNHAIARRNTVQLLSSVSDYTEYTLYCIGVFDPGIPSIMDVEMEKISFDDAMLAYKKSEVKK